MSPGDALSVRIPKTAQTELLKFQGEDSLYQNSDLQVQAVVSRTLARVDQFYGDGAASIIMTNEQMQKYFGIEGYRTISIALKEHANAVAVTDEIRKVVSGVSDCVVKDYTEQIKVQNFYLNQKMLFFYGIAFVLLVISLLHIMNSMPVSYTHLDVYKRQTLHCGITRKTIEQIRQHKRKMNIVSRGGSLVFAWMCMTCLLYTSSLKYYRPIRNESTREPGMRSM